MATINLRDHYPSEYTTDLFVEVSDEVAGAMAESKRQEHAYYERTRYHRAHYSLDRGDGIESDAIDFEPSPEWVFEDKLMREQLYAALAALPERQRQRIHQHYILGVSRKAIAEQEGVSEVAIHFSIQKGLQALKNIFEKFNLGA